MFQQPRIRAQFFTIGALLALFVASAAVQAEPVGLVTGEGTINKVLASERKVNVSHAAIPALKWPAMTMDLGVAEAVSLDGIEAGDEVTFQLRKEANGSYVIESLAVSTD